MSKWISYAHGIPVFPVYAQICPSVHTRADQTLDTGQCNPLRMTPATARMNPLTSCSAESSESSVLVLITSNLQVTLVDPSKPRLDETR